MTLVAHKIMWPYSLKSRVRHNFHEECEQSINQQINVELEASHFYMGLAWAFKHDSIALPGFYSMFKLMSKEEVDHAWKLVEYQTLRGGSVRFSPIAEPGASCQDNLTPSSAIDLAYELELRVTKMIENVHSLASKHDDRHLCDFLEDSFIREQYEALKYLGDLRTRIDLVKDGSGLYHLDLKLCEKHSK